ncbi:hypothetical protein FKP32DRAFT_1591724 [Trametes sanguinea]|nr:hypothetical protein FKP32DRAFT_1591724 [Trametes sanguinea]
MAPKRRAAVEVLAYASPLLERDAQTTCLVTDGRRTHTVHNPALCTPTSVPLTSTTTPPNPTDSVNRQPTPTGGESDPTGEASSQASNTAGIPAPTAPSIANGAPTLTSSQDTQPPGSPQNAQPSATTSDSLSPLRTSEKGTDTTLPPSVGLSPVPTPDSASSTSTVTVVITPSPSPSGSQRSSSNGVSGAASNSNHTGAIVGGVIGGLALILIALAAAVLIRRHRRAMRTAPSAEFMDIARRGGLKSSSSPDPATMHLDSSMSPTGDRLIPLARQSSLEDDERPPAFTPGSYSDPVFEKVQAAAEMREQYRQRESYTAALRLDTGGGAASDAHGSDEKSGGYGFRL